MRGLRESHLQALPEELILDVLSRLQVVEMQREVAFAEWYDRLPCVGVAPG